MAVGLTFMLCFKSSCASFGNVAFGSGTKLTVLGEYSTFSAPCGTGRVRSSGTFVLRVLGPQKKIFQPDKHFPNEKLQHIESIFLA